MAERKKPKNVGNDSPARTRRDKEAPPERTVRKGYEAAQEPEAQGDGDPGPEETGADSSLQQPG